LEDLEDFGAQGGLSRLAPIEGWWNRVVWQWFSGDKKIVI
jgi:hypothetical protein